MKFTDSPFIKCFKHKIILSESCEAFSPHPHYFVTYSLNFSDECVGGGAEESKHITKTQSQLILSSQYHTSINSSLEVTQVFLQCTSKQLKFHVCNFDGCCLVLHTFTTMIMPHHYHPSLISRQHHTTNIKQLKITYTEKKFQWLIMRQDLYAGLHKKSQKSRLQKLQDMYFKIKG